MVENDKVRMHQFVVHLMKEVGKTTLYIAHVIQAARLLFSETDRFFVGGIFALDASRGGVLGVIADYPEVFQMSGNCCFIQLRNPDKLSILTEMWPVSERVMSIIKQSAGFMQDRNECDRIIDMENFRNEGNILDNPNYINSLCETLEKSGGEIHTDMDSSNVYKETENLYLTKALFSILSRFYGKKLYDKTRKESYEFSHEWKGEKLYIRVSKTQGVDNLPAYGIFKINKTTAGRLPRFCNHGLGYY